MKHVMILAAIAAITFANPTSALQQSADTRAEQTDPLPAWMAGAWMMSDGENWGDEYWTQPRAGLMIGAARTGNGERLTSWESTRISYDENGQLAFWAMPNGTSPTKFIAALIELGSITFTNAAHDYPQRVRYWRDGALLRAEISLIDGSNAMQFAYRPMGGP